MGGAIVYIMIFATNGVKWIYRLNFLSFLVLLECSHQAREIGHFRMDGCELIHLKFPSTFNVGSQSGSVIFKIINGNSLKNVNCFSVVLVKQ
ncbi:hypothetical protein V6N12_009930 [Hibiscus sabdariffa]|uniref:Uncharacterized protein n=1 Tax=Hibiscus sabdariffa TaxID=183260 RepID=A0ABR2EC63_9ROSI